MGGEPAHDQRGDDGHAQQNGALRRARVGVDRGQIANPGSSCRPEQAEDEQPSRGGERTQGRGQLVAVPSGMLEPCGQHDRAPTISPVPGARYVQVLPRMANTSLTELWAPPSRNSAMACCGPHGVPTPEVILRYG